METTSFEVYWTGMEQKEPESRTTCPSCGKPCRSDALQTCLICRSLFCRQCSVYGYGRDFCSRSCAELFFHGDEDDYDA